MMSDLIMSCETVSETVLCCLSIILAKSWEIRTLNFDEIF